MPKSKNLPPTPAVNTIDDAFGYTQESAWLAAHAHEYGFIIRYPQGKEDITGYQYEPWHIRYVGSKIAKKIYERHVVISELLMELGVDMKTAEEDACRIEHVISDKTFKALKKHRKEYGGN